MEEACSEFNMHRMVLVFTKNKMIYVRDFSQMEMRFWKGVNTKNKMYENIHKHGNVKLHLSLQFLLWLIFNILEGTRYAGKVKLTLPLWQLQFLLWLIVKILEGTRYAGKLKLSLPLCHASSFCDWLSTS